MPTWMTMNTSRARGKVVERLEEPLKGNWVDFIRPLGINPSICMHKSLLKEEARPIRQQQR
ncbi:hypothetical protein CR513_56965, partial [Mucuna pruriens]